MSSRLVGLVRFSKEPGLNCTSKNDFLFELDTTIDVNDLSDQIIESVQLHEPRAIILDINVVLNNNTNEIQVSIQFQVVTTEEIVKLELSLARLR